MTILDGTSTVERCLLWSNLHGMRHEVVTRRPGQKEFAVLPRRRMVERGFGWLAQWGGLLRDGAGRLDAAVVRIECAATEAMINPA